MSSWSVSTFQFFIHVSAKQMSNCLHCCNTPPVFIWNYWWKYLAAITNMMIPQWVTTQASEKER